MNHFIIGTAGHIDHGKTALIRALTGIETDRLKEEQKRGITIELGFAYMDLDNGERAGIIDVPGHEKFIKNMLAGVAGIDIVLLVIAADEGVMPQTVEHLNILSLLGVSRGYIVLTKIDLVDADWLEMVEEDVRAQVADTFLADAPIVKVSAFQNVGIDQLKALLTAAATETEQKDVSRSARLPIDRVFTMDGFGTVVTGTLLEGTIAVGQKMTLYPQCIETKIKQIQIHQDSSETAVAGQRVALNLANIAKGDLPRGTVLAAADSLLTTMLVDVELKLLKDISRPIEQRTRIRFYAGSAEVFGRVVLLEGDTLEAGQTCYAQLRLEESVALKLGDRFVIRFYSPLETIGGGVVLDVNPAKHRKKEQNTIAYLDVRAGADVVAKVAQTIERYSFEIPTKKYIGKLLNLNQESVQAAVDSLLARAEIMQIKGDIVMHNSAYQVFLKRAVQALEAYHGAHPLRRGMPIEEFRSRIFGKDKATLAESLMARMQDEVLAVSGGTVYMKSFKIELSEEQQKCKMAIVAAFKNGAFKPPLVSEITAKECRDSALDSMVDLLIAESTLVRVDDAIIFHADVVSDAKRQVKALIERDGGMQLADFRDAVQTSRKFAVALLEYFDRIQFTKKQGDVRQLSKNID